MDESTDYCVTVTPTIMDGTVVRWYRDLHDADHGFGDPLISASRNGVVGHNGYLTPDLFDRAWAAHEAIKRGDNVRDLATHQRKSLLGDLVPVEASR